MLAVSKSSVVVAYDLENSSGLGKILIDPKKGLYVTRTRALLISILEECPVLTFDIALVHDSPGTLRSITANLMLTKTGRK